jgi:hypothetical protein
MHRPSKPFFPIVASLALALACKPNSEAKNKAGHEGLAASGSADAIKEREDAPLLAGFVPREQFFVASEGQAHVFRLYTQGLLPTRREQLGERTVDGEMVFQTARMLEGGVDQGRGMFNVTLRTPSANNAATETLSDGKTPAGRAASVRQQDGTGAFGSAKDLRTAFTGADADRQPDRKIVVQRATLDAAPWDVTQLTPTETLDYVVSFYVTNAAESAIGPPQGRFCGAYGVRVSPGPWLSRTVRPTGQGLPVVRVVALEDANVVRCRPQSGATGINAPNVAETLAKASTALSSETSLAGALRDGDTELADYTVRFTKSMSPERDADAFFALMYGLYEFESVLAERTRVTP